MNKNIDNIKSLSRPDNLTDDTDKKRECFINAILPLVYAAAKRFRGRGADDEELYQSGALGLIKAYDGYDSEKGVPFPSYAFKFIEGEIRNTLRKSRSVHLSRGACEKMSEIKNFIHNYEEKNTVPPDLSEISDALGIEKNDICFYMNISADEISLNAGQDGGETVCDFLKSEEDTERTAVSNTLRRQIISVLPKPEADVIMMRYESDMTQTETAQKLNCSQSKVSKLEKSALAKIRTVFQ